MNSCLNILAVSRTFPRPDTASGDRRFAALLRQMAGRHRVDFCCTAPWHDPEVASRYAPMLRDSGVRVLPTPDWRNPRRAALRRLYDVILFEFWQAAEEHGPLLRRLQPWAKVVVDSVDAHFLREEAGLALGHLDAWTVAANKQAELGVYRSADAVLVVTAEDHAALEACGGMPDLCHIPNVLPIRERSAAPRGPELLFVGGFRHAPNADGLLWFAREAWPAVRAEVPAARLTVVGSHPTPEVVALGRVEGIEVVGYVPETAPYLDRAAVSVAPLRYGAGMKGKVNEAMASALPVVTTTVGAQGLGAVSGEHLMVADEPQAFARAVVELLRDPERAASLGRTGQALVRSICAPEVVGRRLEGLLDALGPARPVPPPAWWLGQSLQYHAAGFARLTLKAAGIRAIRQSWKARSSAPGSRIREVVPGPQDGEARLARELTS